MKRFSLFLILIFIVCLASCDNVQYIVKVNIKNIDADTSDIIASAVTTVDSGERGIVAKGITTFNLAGGREYTFTSKAFGYDDTTFSLFVDKSAVFYDASMDKTLALLGGYLLDSSTLDSIPGADVTISSSGHNDFTRSDMNGYFDFYVPILYKKYTVFVASQNYCSESIVVDVASDLDMGNIFLTGSPGSIVGKVYGHSSSYLSGVSVSVSGYDTVKTGWDGSFSLQGLKPGDYDVEFCHKDYVTYIETVALGRGENLTLQVILEAKPSRIIGTTNASRVYLPDFGRGYEVAGGKFIIGGLEPGTYHLVFTREGYYDDDKTVDLGPNVEYVLPTVTLLPKTGSVVGRAICYSTSDPIETGSVTIQGPDLLASLDSLGRFSFSNVPVGTYDILIESDSYTSTLVKSVEIKDSETSDIGDIFLTLKPSSVTGIVRCLLYKTNLSCDVTLGGYSATTDSNGYFLLDNVIPCTYQFEIDCDGYFDYLSSISIDPNKAIDMGVIYLDPCPCSVTGTTNPGATVLLTCKGNSLDCIADNLGRFSFSNVSYGNIAINLSLDNHSATSHDFNLTPGSTLDVGQLILNPLPGSISGTTNATSIYITNIDYNYLLDGNTFVLDDLAPGDYHLDFSRAGYHSTDISVTVMPGKDSDLGNITLEPKDSVLFGQVGCDCDVTLLQTGATYSLKKYDYFEFDELIPDNYLIKFERDGYLFNLVEKLVEPGSHNNVGTITISNKIPGWGEGSVIPKESKVQVLAVSSKSIVVDIPYQQSVSYECTLVGTSLAITRGLLIGPNGEELVKHWTYLLGIHKTGTLAVDPGKHTIEVEVKGLGGSGIFKLFWENETIPPLINFSDTYCYNVSLHTVFVTAVDENSGVKSVEYRVATDRNQPSSGYTSISNGGGVSLNKAGTYYLHVRATDNAGNVSHRHEGPYIID